MSNLQKHNSQNNNKNKFRLFNDKTINRLCQDLEREDWIDVYSKTDAQDAYDHFYTTLCQLSNENVPLVRPSNKRSKNGQRVPWITKGILNQGKLKIYYVRSL